VLWPAAGTSAGHRTTALAFAGTWTVCLASAFSFTCALPSPCAPVSSVTVASIAFAVLFCSTA